MKSVQTCADGERYKIDLPARRPRGRPPLADKRSPRGGFNGAEWAKVKEAAKAEGMTASAWVRARCGL